MRTLFVLMFVVVASGCSTKSEQQTLRYQFNEQSCDTGPQDFTSKEEYCNGLLDDSRNGFCARADRLERYDSYCK